ncbi:hypothetical protein BDW68DRAFT_163470 [Aspergillus falconensis]
MKLPPLKSTLLVIGSLVLALAFNFEPDTQGSNVHDYYPPKVPSSQPATHSGHPRTSTPQTTGPTSSSRTSETPGPGCTDAPAICILGLGSLSRLDAYQRRKCHVANVLF